MEISLQDIGTKEKYKLLTGLIFPRPIALVSTFSEGGIANCAPFSWFNAISEDPPLIYLSFNRRTDGGTKHSLENILRTGEFVVNLVDESIANEMHLSSQEFAKHVSEFEKVGISWEIGKTVTHPRILEAPVSMECKFYKRVDIGPEREFIIGEILMLHAREGIIDPNSFYVSETQFWPVGRLSGTKYCSTRDRFDLPNSRFEKTGD
jgi:flavin reductase (DIM6/NTAB) family NADH-FMN oxidoreductase RutF